MSATPVSATDAATAVFARLGGDLVDPPTLMPAALPLELSGEAVRARLCVFANGDGYEQALRPDLTLPVAQAEADARAAGAAIGETVARYAARAFRLPTERGLPVEFTQVGFERFGAASDAATDAETFALVSEAADAAGVKQGTAWFGDLSIFPAFVDALDLAPSSTDAIKRAFRQAGGVRALLDAPETDAQTGLAARLKGASWEAAEAMVRDVLAVSNTDIIGTRTLPEIVERLMAKAAEAEAGGVPDAVKTVLDRVLAVETTPEKTPEALAKIAKDAGLTGLDPLLDRFSKRFDAISQAAPLFLKDARFGTPFGRRFNYYDGFVFELFTPGAPPSQPFGAGGRYDSLLSRLSDGAVTASAIGGVIRPDRVGGAHP